MNNVRLKGAIMNERLMARILSVIMIYLCFVPFSAIAGEKEDLAEQMLNLVGAPTLVERGVNYMVQKQERKISEMDICEEDRSRMTEKFSKLREIIKDEIRWDYVKNDFVILYARTFSEEDLRGIIEFYKSPAGQHMLMKEELLTQKAMALLQEKMQMIEPKIENIDAGWVNPTYCEQGDINLKDKKYDKAIENYTKAIEKTPSDAMAYNNRGRAYDAKGLYDQAIADYNKAIDLNPKSTSIYYNRGVTYYGKRVNGQAISDFTNAIELDQKNISAYFSRANAYDDIGLYELAVADYDKVLKLNPKNASAYRERGTAHFNHGLYDLALSDYNHAIELDSQQMQAYEGRGNVYLFKGQFKPAIAEFTKAIDIDPDYEYAYLRLLIATWLSKAPDSGAIEKLGKHVSAKRSAEWVRTISMFYLGVKDTTEQSVLEEAKKGEDEKVKAERLCEAYFYLGVKRLAEGNKAGAAEFFAKSVETNIKYFMEYGESQMMLSKIKEGEI
jgi:lipoprotein NlpI